MSETRIQMKWWQLLLSKDPAIYKNEFDLYNNCERLGIKDRHRTLIPQLRAFLVQTEKLSLSSEMIEILQGRLEKLEKPIKMAEIRNLLEALNPTNENDKDTIKTWILMTSGEKNTVESMLGDINKVLNNT